MCAGVSLSDIFACHCHVKYVSIVCLLLPPVFSLAGLWTCYRVGRGLQSGRQGHQFSNKVWSMGDAEERSSGSAVACPAGEETAQSHSACQLPSLPDDGD